MNQAPHIDLPAMGFEALEHVYTFERFLLAYPQVDLRMEHRIHAGMYSRTVALPAGRSMTGALIDRPTQVTIFGDVWVWTGEWKRITGHAVLNADAGRKQLFEAVTDTIIQTAFGTSAKTLAAAELELTADVDRLASRRPGALNDTIITGKQPCPV